jgi:hypothetical protein
MEALTTQFAFELDKSLRRIEEAMSPYTRFVRAEREKLTAVRTDLKRIADGLARLRDAAKAL